MIGEVFNALKKVKPYFLLIVFLTLCMTLQLQDGDLLRDPISYKAFAIPVFVVMSYILMSWWTTFVTILCNMLPKEDLINMGRLLACSLLTFALLITFSSLGSSVHEHGLSIVGRPGFTYTITIYLLAFVTFDLSRR